jgi:hypothetical protein
VKPGGLRDQVVDVAAAAQPRNHAQAADHRTISVPGGQDHPGQLASGGLIPPDRYRDELARHH